MPPRSRNRATRGDMSAGSSPANTPPRRSRSARTADLSGMDLGSEKDDEEYNEPAADEEEEEEEEVDANEEEEEEISLNKRKRDRKAVTEEDKESESAEVDAEPVEEGDKEGKEQDAGEQEEGEEEEEEEEEEEGEGEGEGGEGEGEGGGEGENKERKQGPKKRGRKRTKLTMNEDGGYYDEDGNLLHIVNDEVVIENEDPKGKEKIDESGNLQGGRRFRNKVFTVLGQGDRKYMVSTEPARLVGFRDSYLLFKTHSNLFKRVCNHEEKMDLIERNIIPNSYKGRSVNLVTARSIYREFGAKVLVDGKKVIDDFWEQKARDNGDIEGEYADPAELYNYNMARNGGLDGQTPHPSHNNQPTPLSGTALVGYQNDPTWMYQIATQTRELNSRLLELRGLSFRGVKDVYTGLNFFPAGTQASICDMKRVVEDKDENQESKPSKDDETIVIDTKFVNPDIRKKVTGLKSLPKLFIDGINDDDLKASIMAQIQYEKSM